LREPLADGPRRALTLLGDARRLQAAGREREAIPLYRRALEAWPASQEAALRVAQDEVAQAQLEAARTRLGALLQDDAPQPPWVRPWARLLAGRLEDLAGHRAEALQQYNQVLQQPLGSVALKEWAAAGLRRPFSPLSHDESGH
jgi:tetratricopeptide (TPR) repeat protein